MTADHRTTVARDIMVRTAYVVRPEMRARDAVMALARRGFSGAPVVDANGQLVGIISEQDLMRHLAVAAFEDRPPGVVRDMMSSTVRTAPPDHDIFQLVGLFRRFGVRRIPIVEEGRMIGLVTRRDVASALATICERRCSEQVPGTLDAMAELEAIHNPFPGPGRWRVS